MGCALGLDALGDLLDLLAPAGLVASLLERLGGVVARGLSGPSLSPPNAMAAASTVSGYLDSIFLARLRSGSNAERRSVSDPPATLTHTMSSPAPGRTMPSRASRTAPLPPQTLLESGFPFCEVSAVALADRQCKDSVYSVHKWWARRPPAVIRALLLAATQPASTTSKTMSSGRSLPATNQCWPVITLVTPSWAEPRLSSRRPALGRTSPASMSTPSQSVSRVTNSKELTATNSKRPRPISSRRSNKAWVRFSPLQPRRRASPLLLPA